MENEALHQEDPEGTEGTDYILQGGYDSVWITVNNVSVNIVRREDGVSVALYPLHQETNDCIAETWATWGEGVRECPECDQVLDPEATHCPTCSGSDYA